MGRCVRPIPSPRLLSKAAEPVALRGPALL